MAASLACLFETGPPERSKEVPRRSSLWEASRLPHFFANVMETNEFGGFAILKMAVNGILHHGLKLPFGIRRCEYRMS